MYLNIRYFECFLSVNSVHLQWYTLSPTKLKLRELQYRQPKLKLIC